MRFRRARRRRVRPSSTAVHRSGLQWSTISFQSTLGRAPCLPDLITSLLSLSRRPGTVPSTPVVTVGRRWGCPVWSLRRPGRDVTPPLSHSPAPGPDSTGGCRTPLLEATRRDPGSWETGGSEVGPGPTATGLWGHEERRRPSPFSRCRPCPRAPAVSEPVRVVSTPAPTTRCGCTYGSCRCTVDDTVRGLGP